MSHEQIGIGMIGCGTVGSGVAKLLIEHGHVYAQRLGQPLALRRVLVRDTSKARDVDGLDGALLAADAEEFFATQGISIIVEVAGTAGASAYIERALDAGKHVVTANKALLAADGPRLFAKARQQGVSVAFEAACCAGLPVITALNFGLAANRIDGLYGILNGTCNYILTQMTQQGTSYADALADAQRLGFAEADPTLDVSGQDAGQKLALLASLAFGSNVSDHQVTCRGIDELDLADIGFAAELGYDVKLLAIAERSHADGDTISVRVDPCFLHADVALAQVRGSFNALSVYGHATGHTMYYGRGAGQMPTASAVVSDLINVASGWYGQAFGSLNSWPGTKDATNVLEPDQLVSRFYLRINAKDTPGVMAEVSRVLGDAGISLGAILQHEVDADQFVPVVIITHKAPQGALRRALAQIEQLPVVNGTPICIRIVDVVSDQ